MRHKLFTLASLLVMGLLLAAATPSTADQTAVQPKVIAISSGGTGTSVALLDNGTLWAWGYNEYGQFGIDKTVSVISGPVSTPEMVPIDHVIEAKLGGTRTVALKDDGTVWEWGYMRNTHDGEVIVAPRQVEGLSDIIHIYAGGFYSFALDRNGFVWAWGDNSYGNFGNNESGRYVYPPVKVPVDHVKDIACGPGTALLKDDGTVWTAGYGDNGIGCCEDSEHPSFRPDFRQVPIADVTAVSSGGAGFMLALKKDGTVWGWGDNTFYELGGYTETNEQLTPVRVGGLTDVVAISAGDIYGMALKKDGTVWTWGLNSLGNLGNGINSYFKTPDPIRVAGLDHVKAIAASGEPGIALKDDGTVWTWGLPGQSIPK